MADLEPQAQPGSPPLVVEYESSRKINHEAARSLIFGLLLIVPFVTGILAIRHGRKGAELAEQIGTGRRKSLIGFILGVGNLLLWAGIVISVPFAALRARQAAQVVQCMSQLRQLSVSMMMYASANGGWIPAALPALPSGAIPSCPAAPGTPNYIYATPQVRIGAIASPSTYVTMYEPITNHARGVNFAYLDGHVAFISPARAQKMINELKAGYNPPRPANIR